MDTLGVVLASIICISYIYTLKVTLQFITLGTLFTNESFHILVKNFENGNCNRYISSFGDVTIGDCAKNFKIKIGNSYDKDNKPRFHPHDYK